MADLVRYHCAACGETSEAEVTGFAAGPMADALEALRQSPGAGPALRTGSRADIENAAVRAFAAPYLRFAVCPRCGARNPEGVVEERRDHRNIKLFTLGVTAALTGGALFTRWVAFGTIALFAALALWSVSRVRPAPPTRSVVFALLRLLDVAVLAAAITIVVKWPHLASLVPLLIGLNSLRAKSTPGDSALWASSTQHLHFR